MIKTPIAIALAFASLMTLVSTRADEDESRDPRSKTRWRRCWLKLKTRAQ